MKKFILGIIIFSFFSLHVEASTLVFERTAENNYGVNKKWVINDKNRDAVLNTPLVNASEKIYDFANILNDKEEKSVYDEIMNFKNVTGMEFVLVAVNLPYSDDSENEDYAADFYDYNDFGLDDQYYSGVLLLRNTYEEDPYYNVYMFGEAQLYYDATRADRALDDIYPYFTSKVYGDGIKKFIADYLDYYLQGVPKTMDDYYLNDMGFLVRKYEPPFLIAVLVGCVISGVSLMVMIGNHKLVRPATQASVYRNEDTVNISKRLVTLFSTHTVSHLQASSSSGSGTGSSHSGSSGGGHSSGGGRHG